MITLASAVVLARLISPSGFGQAVVPLIFVPLAVILTFEGFGSALVQRKEIGRVHVEAAMLASLLTGVVLTSLTLALAEPVGKPLFGSDTAELLMMISPVFLLAGLCAVSRGLLWRRLDFRRVSLIEMVALALSAVAAVGLAVAGLDAEAIVLGGALRLRRHRPAPACRRAAAVAPLAPRRAGRNHGLRSAGLGRRPDLVAITNATLAVAAVRLSPSQVGLFWRAFQLGVIYQEKISGIMIRLAFPVYSRTTDLKELCRFHERATRIHAAVLLPLLSLLIVTAPDLVPWLFGERWAPAVEPVQILCVAGMIAAILTGYAQIMLAAGKPRVLLVFNVFLLALYVIASWIAAPYGITALAIAVVGVHVVLLVSVYAVLFQRVLGIPIRRLVTDLFPAVASSVLMLAVANPVAELLRNNDVPVFLLLLSVGIVGAWAYLAALYSLFPAIWNDVAQLTRRVLPDRPTSINALIPRRAVEGASS